MPSVFFGPSLLGKLFCTYRCGLVWRETGDESEVDLPRLMGLRCRVCKMAAEEFVLMDSERKIMADLTL